MIEPKDAYNYVQSAFRNGELREELDVLTLASEDDVHVYACNNRGFVGLYVFRDVDMLKYEDSYTELFHDESECNEQDREMFEYVLECIYHRYLADDGRPEEDEYYDEDEYDGISYPERIDIIESREEDIALAFDEFLSVISPEFYGDECDNMLNDVLALLAGKYGADIYRPMFVQTEDGDVVYTEYPYDYEYDPVLAGFTSG